MLLYSCKKDSKEVRHDKNADVNKNFQTQLKKENTGERSIIFGGNIKKVAKITYDDLIIARIRNTKEWKTFLINDQIDSDNINLITFTNTHVELVTIPLRQSYDEPQSFVHVYYHGNKFVVTKMTISKLRNGNQKVSVTSMDGQLFYQLEINPENKIGNWNFFKPISLKGDYAIIIEDNISDTSLISPVNPDNAGCGSLPFYQCVNCLIINVCGSDWVCTIACGLALPSCIGAAIAYCVIF